MALMIEAFPDHLRAIGVIAVRWAAVDKMLYDILSKRLLMAEAVHTLRTCGAGKSRLEYFAARLKEADVSVADRDTMLAGVAALIALADERNLIIHGQYGVMMGGDNALAPSYSDIGLMKRDDYSNDRLDPRLVTIEHFTAHADEVDVASQPLRDFVYRR